MEILAEVFLFVDFGSVLRVFHRAERELVAEIRRWSSIGDAAGAVLPRTVDVAFSA